MTEFSRAILWEFVQNLPLIAGFVVGSSLWRQNLVAAMISMIVGSIVGSLAIRATESRIVDGHHEPARLVVANVVSIALIMLALSAYLSASWSGWQTDLLLGSAVGVLLGIVQSVVVGESIGTVHCAALGLSFPLGLIGVRAVLATGLPLVWASIIITAVITLLISVLDYL